jgi:ParB/RepB/Spo0J family partition protein
MMVSIKHDDSPAVLPTLQFLSTNNLIISDLNPRQYRDEKRINEIADLVTQYGFDPAYALKVYPQDGKYYVFAGGNRFLAAKQAGLAEIPVYVYEGLSRDKIWQLAYRDNEQAGKHCTVSPVDVWKDYAKRIETEGWTQQQMADLLNVSRTSVVFRIQLSKQNLLQKEVLDNFFDEGHCQEFLRLCSTSNILQTWLAVE